MRKMVIKGISQTLVLMFALFLLVISIMTVSMQSLFSNMTEEDISELTDQLSEVLQEKKEAEEEDRSLLDVIEETPTLRERLYTKLTEDPRFSGFFYAGMFGMLALFVLPDLFPWDLCEKRTRILILVKAGLFLACGIPFLIAGETTWAVVVMNVLYTLVLAVEIIALPKEKRAPSRYTPRILLLLAAVANLCFSPTYTVFVLAVIALRALQQILWMAFSQIQLGKLRKIIRKTYAAEILLGLLLLMVALSLVLCLLDPGMKTFGDALWFCFATITTIGYGDIAVTTAVGRVISVILGMYGIIVVALITSIIVNFYNEMKSEKKEEKEET